MKAEFVSTIILILWNISNVFGYRIFYMKESGSCSGRSVEINMGSHSRNSSGILRSGDINEPGLNCSIYLRSPLSYGVVVSIRNIDLAVDCENYLEISPVEHHGSAKLCGYSNDQLEFQSYVSWTDMRIEFHSSNYTSLKKASFQLTFTAVRSGDGGFCFREERRCHNQYCIWKGLACDGHNNCGDLSDEIDKHVSQCATMSAGESLAVILVTIVGSLILLFIAAYLRGPKITQQIERLSQTNRTNDNSPSSSSPSRTASANRIRTNYGSISQLLTSCDYSDVICSDPPPRYEDIHPPRVPTNSLQTSQPPVIPSVLTGISVNSRSYVYPPGS